MKEHSEEYNKIIKKIKSNKQRKKIVRFILSWGLYATGVILSFIWHDWRLILIILIFISANNIERKIK